MATIGAKAIRRANAVARLEKAATVLAERHGIAAPVAVRYKDPDLQQTADIEAICHFLEGLDVATAPDLGEALDAMKRTDLDAYAEGLGIKDAADYPNKPALIDAIKKGNKTMDDEQTPTSTTTPAPMPMPEPQPTDQGGEDEGE